MNWPSDFDDRGNEIGLDTLNLCRAAIAFESLEVLASDRQGRARAGKGGQGRARAGKGGQGLARRRG